MYQHVTTDPRAVGLHDCRATRAECQDGTLSLFFPDGIYVLGEGEARKTGEARVDISLLDRGVDAFTVYLFPRKWGKTRREDVSNTFLSDVNHGRYAFEIVSVLTGYQRLLYKGDVFFDKPPYVCECELETRTDRVTFSWEDARA